MTHRAWKLMLPSVGWCGLHVCIVGGQQHALFPLGVAISGSCMIHRCRRFCQQCMFDCLLCSCSREEKKCRSSFSRQFLKRHSFTMCWLFHLVGVWAAVDLAVV